MYLHSFKKIFKSNELLVQVFVFIILNFLITKSIYYSLELTEEIYSKSSIFVEVFEHITISISLLLLIPLLLFNVRWKDVIDSNLIFIKYFVLFVLTVWAWNIITLDFNLYFNQAYHFDRFILLALFILSFRYPMFIVYFLILALLFYTQINYPHFDYQFPRAYNNPRLLIEILILFSIYMLVKRFYKNISIWAFFIVVIAFHASNYFIPGIGKIWISDNYIDWMWSNDLSNILAARYFHGWLAEVISSEDIVSIVSFFHTIAIPMQIFAFVAQTVALFIFIKHRFALMIFMSFELLHIAVFLVSGIFFWEWILVNLAIIYVIKRLNSNELKMIFNYKIVLVTLPFIFLGNKVFHSSVLAWYDTPLSSSYKIYATTEKGDRYRVDNNLFAPYDLLYYYDSLTYMIDEPKTTYWDTQRQIQNEELKALSNKKDIDSLSEDILKIEQKYGENKFNIEKTKRMKEFLVKYFSNYNIRKDKTLIWSSFAPPKHLYYALDWDKKIKLESNITNIDIVYYKTFYSHYYNRLIQLDKKSILNMKIPNKKSLDEH